jgi:uncharacterized membrane protein YhaH (DUF805 family)
MSIIDTFLSPNGRLSRSRFWLAYIALALVCAGMAYGATRLQGRVGKIDAPVLVLILSIVPLAWINLCLLVKRWHDRNRSGFWLLINLIPGIGQMWTVIECAFVAGTSGGNKYGPSPMKPGMRAPSFGRDIPEDMADPTGAVFVTPDHG